MVGNEELRMQNVELRIMKNAEFRIIKYEDSRDDKKQPCPKCGFLIGVVAGSKEAICRNCGFKDPCCE